MARKVFFSFKYEDVSRAMIVRNSWVTQDAAGFIDAADFEKIKKQGDVAIQKWIDNQLSGTSVTVVLVGKDTCTSRWVNYEVEKSKSLGHGIFGIDISKIPNFKKETTERCGEFPKGYPFHLWLKEDGYKNLSTWIEAAAKAVGK